MLYKTSVLSYLIEVPSKINGILKAVTGPIKVISTIREGFKKISRMEFFYSFFKQGHVNSIIGSKVLLICNISYISF